MSGARSISALPVALVLLFAAWNGARSTAFLEADDVAHYEYARFAPAHPEKFLDVWGRPLATAFYAPAAQGGPGAARLWSLSLGIAAAAAGTALAKRLGARRPWLGGLATVALPYAFVQTYAIMTELLFSVVLAFGLVLWRDKRPLAAALCWTWLPLARPEGFFLGVVFGFLILLDRGLDESFGRRLGVRRCALALVLGAGTAIWWLAGLPHYRVGTWLLSRWPRNWSPESPYGEGSPHPFLFAGFLALVVTPILVPFFVAGVRVGLRAGRRLEVGVVSFVVVLHGTLWTFRLFGSAGYPRYLVVLAPLLGALTGIGLDRAAERLLPSTAPVWKGRLLAAALVVALLAQLVAWPNTGVWHGDLDVKTLNAAGRWFREETDRRGAAPYVVVDHPHFRMVADVDGDGASCKFEPLPFAFAPVGAVAVWETKFAARYSRVSRADLAAMGFEPVPFDEAAGPPPYAWDGSRPPYPDPELADYDWGIFVRVRDPLIPR